MKLVTRQTKPRALGWPADVGRPAARSSSDDASRGPVPIRMAVKAVKRVYELVPVGARVIIK
jgi:hypothetical protein